MVRRAIGGLAGSVLFAAAAEIEDADVIRAFDTAVEGTAKEVPTEFMFAPGGVQTISAGTSAGTWRGRVVIDRQTAGTLQTILAGHLAAGQKPYFDFNHDEAEASAWPTEFFWKDGTNPGVYVRCEWSNPGRKAIVGKSYRCFSPAFQLDRYSDTDKSPARITRAPLCMGGLVNNPAFKTNRPIWARHTDSMKRTPEELQAELDRLTAEVETLTAAAKTAENDAVIQAKNKEIETLKAKLTTDHAEVVKAKDKELETAHATIKAMRKEKADAAIEAAIARGILPAKPAEGSDGAKITAKWRGLIEADSENIPLLLAQPGPAALGERITAGSAPRGGRITLGQEDLATVLRAYHKNWQADQRIVKRLKTDELNELAAPAFYASALRSRLTKPEEALAVIRAADQLALEERQSGLVIQGANSLGSLAGILVVQRSLDLLKYDFPEISRMTTDFSAEPVKYNQAVYTRLRTIPAVTDYNATTGYADSDVTDTDVSVTINQHKAVQIVYTANDLASTQRLLFPEQEEGMHFAMGSNLMSALTALMIPGNFPGLAANTAGAVTPKAVPGTTTIPLDAFARPGVIALKQALNQRGVTGGTRTLLLNELYHGALEADTTIVGNLINRDSGAAIANSRLPMIATFQPFEAPYLPETGNVVGIGFRADAFAIAARLPNDYSTVFPGVTGGGVVQIVTNPDTGMSVMVVMFLDHKLAQTRFRLAWMYGVSVGNPLSAQLLLSK